MKKKFLMGAGILAGIALLAGAAFLGARLLAPVQGPEGAVAGPGEHEFARQMRGGKGGVSVNIQPSDQLPQKQPEITGAVTGIKDNSLMVTAVNAVMVTVGKDGKANTSFDYQGSAVEVVVTGETKIYRDTTDESVDFGSEALKDGAVVEQTLEDGEFSDIAPQSVVTVWGYKRGDRLIAETIVTDGTL